jgi:hypothetical protein
MSWRGVHQDDCLPKLYVGTFIGKASWEYLASSCVNSNSINYWPINVASNGGIKFTHTGLRQINFHRMLVKGFCGRKWEEKMSLPIDHIVNPTRAHFSFFSASK